MFDHFEQKFGKHIYQIASSQNFGKHVYQHCISNDQKPIVIVFRNEKKNQPRIVSARCTSVTCADCAQRFRTEIKAEKRTHFSRTRERCCTVVCARPLLALLRLGSYKSAERCCVRCKDSVESAPLHERQRRRPNPRNIGEGGPLFQRNPQNRGA